MMPENRLFRALMQRQKRGHETELLCRIERAMFDQTFSRVESTLMRRFDQKENGGRIQYVCHIGRAMQVGEICELGLKRFATASEGWNALQICFVC